PSCLQGESRKVRTGPNSRAVGPDASMSKSPCCIDCARASPDASVAAVCRWTAVNLQTREIAPRVSAPGRVTGSTTHGVRPEGWFYAFLPSDTLEPGQRLL